MASDVVAIDYRKGHSAFRHDTPAVYILPATKARTGPFDPADFEFSKAQGADP
jgi:hypothetical protein